MRGMFPQQSHSSRKKSTNRILNFFCISEYLQSLQFISNESFKVHKSPPAACSIQFRLLKIIDAVGLAAESAGFPNMPRVIRRQGDQINVPVNNTVKLTDSLRVRVAKAMAVEGFTVWSEFCRVSLTEKCALVERELKARDQDEYVRTYGK